MRGALLVALLIVAVVAAGVGGYVLAPPRAAPQTTTLPPVTITLPPQTVTTTVLQSSMQSVPSTVPPVKGFYKGQEILFIHTEASDQQVASMLTVMMSSSVMHVPSLRDIPSSLLGDVYVFTNGVKGGGPFGFQSDVFSSVPGEKDYTPLRALKLVAWREGLTAKELRSVEEIKEAEAKGELTISISGVVVNMPIVEWPGGHR